MRRFGVRPDRDLGQNFLIDSNILGVIERAAELRAERRRARDRRRPRGALASTSPSASRTCTWSRSTSACASALLDAIGARANVTRALGRRDGARPRARCARRRQGRREPALRDRRRRAAAHDRGAAGGRRCWVAMVQREVGERLAAAPGTRRLRRARRCSRSSPARCAVAARDPAHRLPPGPERRLGAGRACAAARARRGGRRRRCARSSRARSRTGARRSPARSRSPARAPGARASRCARRSSSSATRRRARRAPRRREDFRGAGAESWAVSDELPRCARSRRRRSTSACSSGRVRDADGAPRAGDRDAVDLARRRAHARARRRPGAAAMSSSCPGVPGPRRSENLAARALRAFRAAHRLGGAAAAADGSRSGSRVAAGLGGGSADAAAALRLARARVRARRRGAAARASRASSAPTCPRRSRPGAGSPRAPASAWSALPPPRAASACSCCPRRRALDGRRSTREADRLGLGARRARSSRGCARSCASALAPRRAAAGRHASCSTTTCSARPSRCAARSPRRSRALGAPAPRRRS